ncbi:hypothetical protein Pmar_PMAR008973 [Perkinsus marinus ATCC 50983]|uniref:Nuclear speckle splicing regulatory protein 1 N-terminal domain-containing protein n=1 Tax=Perkinsus marinus (strain ATCC 50983 / TXsc) TaxID=423536 RepID=C5LM60_PERM5|nr:hypothetical protein Pmar_PMAR008973 [Perkinsus marinus ATCC 50983]EER02191.1 hypothetical protein Pmar_PMAR008973 [Perkinsus marinus ATCC 50983]|eukprot:XP_002769473.1 hypothetical protein Pmar_PMAR008973 [Perkinsus marinus ATCC 50983]
MQEEERSSGSGLPGQSLPLISTQASLSKIEKTEISNMAAAGVFDYDQEQGDEDEVSSLDSGSSERLRRERPKEKPLSPTKALNRPGLVHVTKEGALHAQDAFKNKHSKHMDHILLTADHRAKETDLIKMKFNRKEREKAKDEIGDEGEAFVTGAYIKKQEELKRFEERLKEESKEQEGEKRSSQNFLRNLLSSGRFARSNANEADRERADEKDQEKAEALDDKQQVDEKEEKKEGVLKEVEDTERVLPCAMAAAMTATALCVHVSDILSVVNIASRGNCVLADPTLGEDLPDGDKSERQHLTTLGLTYVSKEVLLLRSLSSSPEVGGGRDKTKPNMSKILSYGFAATTQVSKEIERFSMQHQNTEKGDERQRPYSFIWTYCIVLPAVLMTLWLITAMVLEAWRADRTRGQADRIELLNAIVTSLLALGVIAYKTATAALARREGSTSADVLANWFLLQPCHVFCIGLGVIYWSRRWKVSIYFFNVYLHLMWGVALALVFAEMEEYNKRGYPLGDNIPPVGELAVDSPFMVLSVPETFHFYLEHWVLVLAPFILIAMRTSTIRLIPQEALYGTLVRVLLALDLSLLSMHYTGVGGLL